MELEGVGLQDLACSEAHLVESALFPRRFGSLFGFDTKM